MFVVWWWSSWSWSWWNRACRPNSSAWLLLLRLQSWCPIFELSSCNSFEGWAPIDELYGCLIFKLVADIDYLTGYQDSSSNNGQQGNMPHCNHEESVLVCTFPWMMDWLRENWWSTFHLKKKEQTNKTKIKTKKHGQVKQDTQTVIKHTSYTNILYTGSGIGQITPYTWPRFQLHMYQEVV